MTEQERIAELETQVDDLTSRIIDLTFELNYNKQDALLEFIRELYGSLINANADPDAEIWYEKLSKEEIIENLKKYIQKFAKDNNIQL